jgi:small subunit ribosomal protein S8
MDSIGDFIIRIANASAVGAEVVSVPFSNFRLAIAEKLKDMGYVAEVEKKGKKVKKTIEIALKYDGRTPKIRGVKRISKPGSRLYKSVHDIHSVRYGHGSLVLTTPKGIKTDKEARTERIGGEALFEIW